MPSRPAAWITGALFLDKEVKGADFAARINRHLRLEKVLCVAGEGTLE